MTIDMFSFIFLFIWGSWNVLWTIMCYEASVGRAQLSTCRGSHLVLRVNSCLICGLLHLTFMFGMPFLFWLKNNFRGNWSDLSSDNAIIKPVFLSVSLFHCREEVRIISLFFELLFNSWWLMRLWQNHHFNIANWSLQLLHTFRVNVPLA